MKKVVLIGNSDGALALFRGPLIRALVAEGVEVVTVSPGSTYLNVLQAMGARTIEVDLSRHSISIFGNLKMLRNLIRIIRRERPDVVHSFAHKAVIFGCLAARLGKVERIVATVTGLGALFVRSDIRARILRQVLVLQYRYLLPERTKVLFQNPDDKRELEELRAVSISQSILTNGSGVDLSEFSLPSNKVTAQARQMLAAEIGEDLDFRIVVLLPARAILEKGFLEFYRAAGALHEQSLDTYVFVHMGLIDSEVSGALGAEKMSSFAKRHRMHYLGFKRNPRDYMIAADIVALPSFYREGVPRSLIEALALGKAIVTTNTPGCRETVIEGRNGFFCPVRDSEGLAKCIANIDHEFLLKARRYSRTLCETKFDVRKLNALTFELYGLLSRSDSGLADTCPGV